MHFFFKQPAGHTCGQMLMHSGSNSVESHKGQHFGFKKLKLMFSPCFSLWGLRDNVRCSAWAHWKVCSGLPISVNWTFLLGVTADALRAKIDRPMNALQHCRVHPSVCCLSVVCLWRSCTACTLLRRL